MTHVEVGMLSRVIVWVVIVGVIAYDIPAALWHWGTISEAVRIVDKQMNGLVRWGLLALWAHWFVPFWYTGAGKN